MADAVRQLLDPPTSRAAEYRARADDVRRRAASIRWADIRKNMLAVADTYDALTQTIEDIAERQTRPRTPEERRGDKAVS
jgi:hypothetical protein